MGTLAYTTGNPTLLASGNTANMVDISGPFSDLKTWANGNIDGDNISSTAGGQIGLSSSSVTRRGKSIIATSESRSNVAYGTLTTPDSVSVTLPTDGLICVAYQATWQESVSTAARAAIFIGVTQLKVATSAAAPAVQETTHAAATPATDRPLVTNGLGLFSDGVNTAYSGDVTTGQLVGQVATANQPGVCYVFAAAGVYAVSLQFKSSSGSVTAKNRKLWVWTAGF